MSIPTTPTGGEPTAGPWPTPNAAGHWWAKLRLSDNPDDNSVEWEVVQVAENIARPWCEADIESGECMMAYVSGIEKCFPLDAFVWNAPVASAPTLAARVAELEGMLAVAREALRPFGSLYDRALKITGESFAGRVNTCIVNGWLNRAHFALAAQAIAQLDKEAGGK